MTNEQSRLLSGPGQHPLGTPDADPTPTPGTPSSVQHLQDGYASPGRFAREPPGSSRGDRTDSPFRLPMPYISPAQLAFSAMQFLPVPVLVLNNLKTVVLANEAMGRLLGIDADSSHQRVPVSDPMSGLDKLRGQTLSQVGVDMVEDGRPIWVNWDSFLDRLALELGEGEGANTQDTDGKVTGDTTAPGKGAPKPPPNTVLEVVVSRKDLNKTNVDRQAQFRLSDFQTTAKMIITVWEVDEHQTYFTLTFTHSASVAPTLFRPKKSVAHPNILEAADRKILPRSTPPSASSSHDSSSPSHRNSPLNLSVSSSPFPPMGPPSQSTMRSAPSLLQKITTIKDALLNNTTMPILAMWKDGSVTVPNTAARDLYDATSHVEKIDDGYDLLPAWTVWDENFERRLEVDEYPISVLIRTEKPFSGMRIGMQTRDGKRIVYDVLGDTIRDQSTGEFLAGVVTCRDVTKMTQLITQIKQADEERFRLICDTMPQLVWTTTPTGYHDFFNSRWYSYTGLTKEESIGMGWKLPFHPDDIPETTRRWQNSLKTGDPYVTEYRCRSKTGEWRWFLGRALPFRNKETGEVEKWFGTCTDVHESIETKMAAKRTREQLLGVIAHAQVTIFTVNTELKITMLEGALIWDATGANSTSSEGTPWYIGQSAAEVFNRLAPKEQRGDVPEFLAPIEDVLKGRCREDVREHMIDDRWYRTRFLPILGKRTKHGAQGNDNIDGVIGVSMDVTELKSRESDLREQVLQKRQLLANEAAAKEASRLKSQFLANMSHEIRTPITGVMGMAELLLDLELDREQREYTENIYRSANALLTVINDILDFSKVESGRLDIEEVQFSLSVILLDVGKMLGFAADRKGLDFRADISPSIANDLVVLGDPGRVRQIVTNLLTNSIKFTNQGHVKFSVRISKETTNDVEIQFVIEDTGIGIEEDVLKRLFQPFSQGDSSTARKFGGTGLGLTICKNLLDLMQGKIELTSTLGSGTTATFWIPFHKARRDSPNSGLVEIVPISDRLQSDMSVSHNSSDLAGSSTPPHDHVQGLLHPKSVRRQKSVSLSPLAPQEDLAPKERAAIHVLVVEDNAINQEIATKTIKKLGFQVTAAWNGKEALEYLIAAQKGEKTKPDIILMDVQMPVIDGYKCTHLLRHHLPYKAYVQDVPIVAMTASAIQGDREKCKRAGMDDYLAKPVKSKILERMLVQWSRMKRQETSSMRGSDTSECSDSGEHCSNTGIPGLAHEGAATATVTHLPPPLHKLSVDAGMSGADATPTGPPPDVDGLGQSSTESNETTRASSVTNGSVDGDDGLFGPSTATRSTEPDGTSSSNSAYFPGYVMDPPKEDRTPLRRRETDEQALQSRDAALRNAADGAKGAVPMTNHQNTTAPMRQNSGGGDSLTEANVVKHDKEEEQLRKQRRKE